MQNPKNKEDLDFDEQRELFADDEVYDRIQQDNSKEFEDSDDDLFNPGVTTIQTHKGKHTRIYTCK